MEKANRSIPRLDGVILSLLFLGVFIAPMHLRSTLLQKPLDSLRVINFPCALAALLSFVRIRKWEKADFFLAAAWVLLIIPMFFSNRERTSYIQISAPLQLLLPLFLVQAPFNIPGAGNIAGAVMYLSLYIMFLI